MRTIMRHIQSAPKPAVKPYLILKRPPIRFLGSASSPMHETSDSGSGPSKLVFTTKY